MNKLSSSAAIKYWQSILQFKLFCKKEWGGGNGYVDNKLELILTTIYDENGKDVTQKYIDCESKGSDEENIEKTVKIFIFGLQRNWRRDWRVNGSNYHLHLLKMKLILELK